MILYLQDVKQLTLRKLTQLPNIFLSIFSETSTNVVYRDSISIQILKTLFPFIVCTTNLNR